MVRNSKPSLLDEVDYAATSNKVVPLIFALDTSGSMASDAVDSEGCKSPRHLGVLQGLQAGLAYMRRAPELKLAGRVGIVTFGSKVDFSGFTPVDQATLPNLSPCGGTPFCEAMNRVADETFHYTVELNNQRINPTMTTILVITDGGPTDGPGTKEVARLMAMHNQRQAFVWAVGIDDSDRTRLESMGFPADRVVTVAETSWPHIIQLGTMSATAIACGQSPLSVNTSGSRP